jgi:hypothetical protein
MGEIKITLLGPTQAGGSQKTYEQEDELHKGFCAEKLSHFPGSET